MPHLAELVKLHADAPFAVIGINCFDPEDVYTKGLTDYKVSWISAYQGPEEAPIAELYRVAGYPTYVLLDPEGKILAKGHSSTSMDRGIKAALSLLEED